MRGKTSNNSERSELNGIKGRGKRSDNGCQDFRRQIESSQFISIASIKAEERIKDNERLVLEFRGRELGVEECDENQET